MLAEGGGNPFLVFAHNPGEAQKCRDLGLGYDESPEHHELKSRLARAGRRAGWKVELELQPDPTCRADVVASRDSKQWAFEAQFAPLKLPTALERHDRYMRAFGDCTWVHTGPREWATRVPALQIEGVDSASVIAGIKTDATGLHDANPEPMDSVVPRVLNGGLTYVFLDDFGYYLDLRAQAAPRRPGQPTQSPRGRYVRDVRDTCDRPGLDDEPVSARLDSPFRQTIAATTNATERQLLWSGRARMARARMAAGMPLDDVDIEALDRSQDLPAS